MDIRIMSKDDIVDYVPLGTASIISVSTPGCEETQIDENLYENVLRLQFSDVENVSDDSFSTEMAEKVKTFYEDVKSDEIIYQCDAGISRSAGLAAGHACYKKNVKIVKEILINKKPNILVLNLIKSQLERCNEIEAVIGRYLRELGTRLYPEKSSVEELIRLRRDYSTELQQILFVENTEEECGGLGIG